MREADYIVVVLRAKASQVIMTTQKYVTDLSDDCPQELWTMLQYSLHHKITYWLRTCTPAETEEMATLMDACILEAVTAATSIDFDEENLAETPPANTNEGGAKSRSKHT